MSGPPTDPELRATLARRAEPDGFLPFDRFMETALYAPGVGYYDRARSPFGPEGDFYTAARVHPAYAATVARRLIDVRRRLGGNSPFAFVDLGAGDGSLAAGVVRALGERQEANGIGVLLCDRAAAQRFASAEAVRAVAEPLGVGVQVASSIAEVGPVAGFVLAHELLDAQPARRLRWSGTDWRELGLRLEGDRWVGATRELLAPVALPPLPDLGPEDSGVVIEVSAAGEALLREVADHLVAGLLVVVDFGAEEGELIRGPRAGTTAAVRGHRTLASVEESPGQADLSTFVNFTRVRHAAAAAGLAAVAYRSQAEALGAWGLQEEADRALSRAHGAEEEVRVRLAIKNLLFGFGTFRVLELAPPNSARPLAEVSGSGTAERS